MRILALIPARGGSKRLPGKNIRALGGKPLITWSIDVARDIADISDILVSTDDPVIAEIASAAGALVPWLRPLELASDTASSIDVCLHALDWYENKKGAVDGLLLLQPTSPFRGRASVLRGIELFRANHGRSVAGVSPAQSHPMWCFRIEGGAMHPYCGKAGLTLRSQDLERAYVVNGAFYLAAPAELKKLRSFFGDDSVPLVMDEAAASIDIDTDWDWLMAESLILSGAAASPGNR